MSTERKELTFTETGAEPRTRELATGSWPLATDPMTKECPQCGGDMKLQVRDAAERVADGQTRTRRVREWVCPECDYFEEAESGEE